MTASTLATHELDQQLMRAIKSRDADAIRAALAAGANPARLAAIDSPDPDANFALLCTHGADPGHANHKGLAPRIAFERKHHRPPPRDLESCPTLGPAGLDLPTPRPRMQEEG